MDSLSRDKSWETQKVISYGRNFVIQKSRMSFDVLSYTSILVLKHFDEFIHNLGSV